MTRARWMLAALAAVALAAPVLGQTREQAEAEGLAPRRVRIVTAAVPGNAKATALLAALEPFLRIELENGTRLVMALGSDDADLTLTLSAVQARSGWTLSAQPVLKDGTAGAPKTATVADITVDRALAFLKQVAKALDTAYPPVAVTVTEVVKDVVVENTETLTITKGVTLVIEGPPGATLTLPDGAVAILDDQGRWESEQPQNTSFAYRVTLPGHMPQDRVAFVGTKDTVDRVAMELLDNWRFGLDLRYADLVVVPAAEWYAVPGTVFVGLALESSFLSFVQFFRDEENPLVHYLDIQASGGLWLSRADARFRSAFVLGLGTRLDLGAGLFRFSDYAPASLRAGLRLSWELGSGFSVFAQLDARLALILPPPGVDPGLVLDPLPMGIFMLDGAVFGEAPTIFVGGRYGL
ncbi:MAG: hypothetical protein KBB32_09120 [Spirochaetia bacterium]|nr:hypothetical protein [Spirochaetia bacterium]